MTWKYEIAAQNILIHTERKITYWEFWVSVKINAKTPSSQDRILDAHSNQKKRESYVTYSFYFTEAVTD